MDNLNNTQWKKRGFGAMSPERQKEFASRGGIAAHQKGVAHQFDSEEARAAGQKGGRKVSQDRAHMSAIGRRGGVMGGIARRTRKENEEEVSQSKQP